ncbi:hypothetical protein [Burkholderia sp. BCC1988]|uniref:hypothetical protein n=1 Tax=Burkholderia sp. BCC1988 TaxID=2817443 RepID=UPI0039F0AD32
MFPTARHGKPRAHAQSRTASCGRHRSIQYWDACGQTFEDADGYRIVLQNARWRERASVPVARYALT